MNATRKGNGFTLVEMIVSIAVFTVAVLITLSALVSLSNESKKAQTTRAVMGNLGSSIESIARSARMGKNFDCGCPATYPVTTTTQRPCDIDITGANVTGGASCLAFTPIQSGVALPIIFRHNTTQQSIERSTDGGTTFLRFTAPDMRVERMSFFVVGASASNQPAIILSVGGEAGVGTKTNTEFDIQTTVSARTPNF